MANRNFVLLEFLVNSNSHSNFNFEGKINFIAVTGKNGKKAFVNGATTFSIMQCNRMTKRQNATNYLLQNV
jgi:hypothetical protein